MKIQNAKIPPRVFYGMHMEPGLAEYQEPGVDPFRILVSEDTIKEMNSSFSGKPVYVNHVETVDLENIQQEADGYVSESFYNPHDGKTWAKFIVVSDRGHEAVQNGWRLSNAYLCKQFSAGGVWHGMNFDKEVNRAEYDHLAIVQSPRYEDSVIMTPEQFKAYNEKKEAELKRVANSTDETKGEETVGLNFFKRTKVENQADYESLSVMLPKSKMEMTISQIVNAVDAMEVAKSEPQMANGDHMVEVGADKMSVNDLVKKHLEMADKMKNVDLDSGQEEAAKQLAVSDKTENDDSVSDEDSVENEESEDEKKKKAAKEEMKKNNFNKLENARQKALTQNAPKVDLGLDKMARGKKRYGSK